MNELEQLKLRIQTLENLLANMSFNGVYRIQKTIDLGPNAKIGLSATSTLGFFGTTPTVQPSSTGTTSNMFVNGGATVTEDNTFTGGSGTKYTIGDVVKHLKALGLLKP